MKIKENYKDVGYYVICYEEYDAEYYGGSGMWCAKTEIIELPEMVAIYYDSTKKNSQYRNIKIYRILNMEAIDITQTLCYIEYKDKQEELARLERMQKRDRELEIKRKEEEYEREEYERLKKKFEGGL